MELLIGAGGVLLGVIITKAIDMFTKIHGVIHIDHKTELCKFDVTSAELANLKTKKVIFTVNHNARISQEEHML